MVKWSIGTFARLRPPRRGHDCAKFMLDRIDDGRQSTAVIAFPPPDDDDDRVHMKQREALQFHFNDIFDPSVSQDQVFDRVCLDIVYSALDGYNGTILAYGQTGSGKTYTITGGEHYADRGIIPRVLSTIFEEFEQRTGVRYTCYISYLEIYNESVYDLLDRSHTDRPIEEWTKVLLMDDDEGEMHFRNLGVYEAVSEEEALNLLFLGNMNRVTSDTPMNQASSRSHSIFTVMIEARPVDSDIIVTSKLHLVDLAGSERVYKREGTQRMRSEGKHINLSLHHLEQVILSLRSKTKNAVAKGYHVPYRNSMLTSVLRGSLGGNCKSVFIATLNPESDFVDESISSCRFMQRCSEVTVDIAVNSEIDTEKRIEALEKANSAFERTNAELHAAVAKLESELEASKAHAAAQQQHWEREIELVRTEAQEQLAALAQAASASNSEEPLDWIICEELVEKLLVTGELPRDVADDGDDEDRVEARRLFDDVAQELKRLGLDYALGCLTVMKESIFFASNAAAELQEMVSKQSETVEQLEKRLHEQKHESEQLKQQIQRLTEVSQQQQQQTVRGTADAAVTTIPRSKSHSGAVDSKRSSSIRPSSRQRHASRGHNSSSSSNARGFDGSESDSDSDKDSEITPESHRSNLRRRQQMLQDASGSKSRPTPSANGGQPSTMALLIAPLSGAASSEVASRARREGESNAKGGEHQQRTSRDRDRESRHSSDDKASAIRAPDVSERSGTPTTPSALSGSDMIRKRMELLKNGSLFVKYGRYGKPHVRFVWCSSDLEYLNYRTVSKQIPKASIPTRAISRVVLGQATKVFERAKQDAREPFCFSIEYDDSRTLDLEIADGESIEVKKQKRAEWADALQFLVKLKAVQHKKPLPPPPPSVAAPPVPS